jgi:transposase
LYDALTSLSNLEFNKIEDNLSRFFRSKEESNKTAIIDVTDTYFEGSSFNIKPRRGKDGKVKRLIQFALAVTLENGFPLFYKKYSGNLSGIQIFKDMNLELKEKGLDSVIVDRGMTSEENLKVILNLGMKAIAGLRTTPSITKKFISTVERDDIFSPENRVKLKTTSVYIKSFDYMNGKLIVVYNPQLEIIKKEHAFENHIFDKEKKYGYSLIYHNTSLKDMDVVRKYYERDVVERAFKQLKGILKLRPVRVWLNEHIEGHFRICFLAYAILSYMDFKLKGIGISAVDALDSLKYGYKVELKDSANGHEWNLWVPLEPKQKKIIESIGVVYKNQ